MYFQSVLATDWRKVNGKNFTHQFQHLCKLIDWILDQMPWLVGWEVKRDTPLFKILRKEYWSVSWQFCNNRISYLQILLEERLRIQTIISFLNLMLKKNFQMIISFCILQRTSQQGLIAKAFTHCNTFTPQTQVTSNPLFQWTIYMELYDKDRNVTRIIFYVQIAKNNYSR